MDGKNILISTLNWGLGHASRSIPIIRELMNRNAHSIVLAADGDAFQMLSTEFPQLKIYKLPDINIHYLKGWLLPYGLFLNGLQLNQINKNEHKQITQIIETHNIDTIISDNRYGVWHPTTKNILITHQLTILPPKMFGFTSPILKYIIKRKIKPFTEIWVPDYIEFPGIAGILSHQSLQHSKMKYIGPLSRYYIKEKPSNEEVPSIVTIISGPMPFRQNLYDCLIEIFKNSNIQTTLFCTSDIVLTTEIPLIKVVVNASFNEINKALNQASMVICSGGYTTLMDLLAVQKKALIIPTPHQTEQEYIAKLHNQNPQFEFLKFDKIVELPEKLSLLEKRIFGNDINQNKPFLVENLDSIFR